MSPKTIAGGPLDPTIQFSTLTIDGEDHKLAYSFKTIRLAEVETKTNLLNGMKNLNNISAGELVGLLWAALLVDKPKTKLSDVDKLVRFDTLVPISEALTQAYLLSIPKKEQEPEPPADPGNQ